MSWSLLMLSNAIIIHIFLSTQSLDNYPDEVLHGSGRNMPRHESTKRSMTIKRTIRIITKHFQMDVLNLIAGYFGGRFSLTLYRWGFLHRYLKFLVKKTCYKSSTWMFRPFWGPDSLSIHQLRGSRHLEKQILNKRPWGKTHVPSKWTQTSNGTLQLNNHLGWKLET